MLDTNQTITTPTHCVYTFKVGYPNSFSYRNHWAKDLKNTCLKIITVLLCPS